MTDSVTDKLYLDAQTLLEDAFRLGVQVLLDGFEPSFIVAVWRGGVPIGIAVQEILQVNDVECDHIAIRTSSYTGIDGRRPGVRVHNMNYIIKNITHADRLLIVDDVFDTGRTIEAIIEHLRSRARRNTPRGIRIAVPYYKPSRNQTGRVPDYFVHETDRWIKFPHSLEGLSREELEQHRPHLHAILAGARPAEPDPSST